MCPDQVDLIHRHAPSQNEPAPVDEQQRYAAWKFYCTVLGGRQVWPIEVARDNGKLWFEVGNTVIETGPQYRDARARVAFAAEVVEDVAIRCWDAGFSVQVRESRWGPPSLALIDPFGRQIDLVPSDQDLPTRELPASSRAHRGG
jgi:catechol 2,3-dioxygenase-like lactoylglutathione lyase family enzyme